MNTLDKCSRNMPSDDEELVELSQNGNTDALTELVCRYMPMIRQRASCYTSISADRDDLIQEGLIGLLAAVKGYNRNRGASFKTFCYVCVQNKMRSELERRSSDKQQALQNYVSLDEIDVSLPDEHSDDPYWIIAAKENREFLMAKAKTLLSDLEQEILSLYLSGHSYEEMATQLNLSTKTVDNALQRVRRKLREA